MAALYHGMKIPCRANRVLGVVEATPSAPPSKTWTSPICQIARLFSITALGTRALTLVTVLQSEPAVLVEVVAHGTVIEKWRGAAVPFSVCEGPFCLSVSWKAKPALSSP